MSPYNPDIHHRRSIRWKGYDYSSCGVYFITICTHDREHLFGDIVDGQMHLNELGDIADYHWQKLSKYHPQIEIDESIVMPNHLHGIIVIVEPSSDKTAIAEIIRGFKTFSAREINKIRCLRGVPLWQRNYFDRVIRSETELDNVRQYIINNPQNWQKDPNYHHQSKTC
jgi:REP element-mobilizing transposase RayT